MSEPFPSSSGKMPALPERISIDQDGALGELGFDCRFDPAAASEHQLFAVFGSGAVLGWSHVMVWAWLAHRLGRHPETITRDEAKELGDELHRAFITRQAVEAVEVLG